jgi:hypothetical protein
MPEPNIPPHTQPNPEQPGTRYEPPDSGHGPEEDVETGAVAEDEEAPDGSPTSDGPLVQPTLARPPLTRDPEDIPPE